MLDFPPPGAKSGFPYQCFFKFHVTSQERFLPFFQIFEVLKQEKQKLYEFLSCHLLAPDVGVLVFLPYSLPYGSSDAIKALLEAFDCEIIGAELGTGYISYI